MEITAVTIQVVCLIVMSSICSGLNVAIVSLDPADLRRKAKLGNMYAKRILPLRRNIHLTLASILLINVAVVSATSLVLESKMNGIIAGLISTVLIVVFGEIFPQAFFSRRALELCGRLTPLLKMMIFLTYPLSKPLQLLLDRLFGPPQPSLQSRRELGIMITEHLHAPASELDDDEVEIMRGALRLSENKVRDIMTPIKKAYWLQPDILIDGAKIHEIKEKGWSRIPVFNRHLKRSFGVIIMKDMIDHNFDEAPMKVSDLPLYPSDPVGSKTALDTMFRKFINAHSHLLPVEQGGKIIGIVTIEDLLEEIVGHEIRDETDRQNERI
jgi:metal transporter CNNM